MNRKTADLLVQKLGMTLEMPRVLESDEDYQRFEKTIDSILEKLKGTKPLIITDKSIRQSENNWYSVHTPIKKWVVSTYKGTDNIDKSIEVFRRRYGIGIPQQNKGSVARELNVGEAESQHGCIKRRINFVSEVLKQQYKRQVWYGTLG